MEDKYSTVIDIKEYVDNLQIFNGLLDTDGKLLMANRAAIEAFGMSYENIVGKYFSDTSWWSYDPHAQKWVENAIERAKKGKTSVSERKVRLGEHNYILSLSLRPVFDKAGEKVEYLVVEGHDITRIKESEKKSNISYKPINSVSDFSGIVDKDGKLLLVNQKTLDYFKCSREDIIGLPFWECSWFVPSSASVKKIKNSADKALKGKISRAKVTVFTSDGQKILINYTLTPMHDSSGEITRVSFEGIIIISETGGKDDLAINSENMYRELVTHMNEGLVVTDQKNKFIFVNPRFCEMLEYTQEEIMGMHAKEILDDKNYNIFVQELKNRRVEGKVSRYELTLITKTGKKLYCLLSAFPVLENGLYKGSNITVTDLTELKEKEEAFQKSEMMYRELVTSMNEGLAIIDETGKCSFVNPRLCEMLEYSEEDLTSMKCEDSMDEQSRLLVINEPAELASGKSSKHEISCFTKSGKRIEILSSASPIMLNGVYKGARVVITDITSIKEMEKKLLQAQKMEAIGVLAGGIAHDFNNILQAISGYTQILLLNKNPDNPEYKDLKAIEESVQKASSLTKQLLVFARKSESNLKPIDLNKAVSKISDILIRTIPKMIKIELSLEKNLKAINADPIQIEQIIMNIGLNAAHAMPDGGRLMIETINVNYEKNDARDFELDQKEYVLLSISDTGIGMDEETQKHIFEPFFTTKEVDSGTGLGLAMVYGIIKNHKGHINCKSKHGYGTTFSIYFPVIKTLPAAININDVVEKELCKGNETILLVDDEEPLRRLGHDLLERQGFTVISAESGEKALEIYKRNKQIIDLVILDVSMPGMGGYMCFEELRKIDSNVKVIIVTGYSADGKIKEIINSGAAAFVGKPYRLNIILNKIREILNTKTAKQ